jgi:hypothetical protein
VAAAGKRDVLKGKTGSKHEVIGTVRSEQKNVEQVKTAAQTIATNFAHFILTNDDFRNKLDLSESTRLQLQDKLKADNITFGAKTSSNA